VRWSGSRKCDVLHCDACGTRLVLLHEDVRDLRDRLYPTSFFVPRPDADSGAEQGPPYRYRVPSEYHAAIEASQRPCHCGGRFRYGALPRRPGCRSTEEMWDVDEKGEVVFHD